MSTSLGCDCITSMTAVNSAMLLSAYVCMYVFIPEEGCHHNP
jgi:hypothetical protein